MWRAFFVFYILCSLIRLEISAQTINTFDSLYNLLYVKKIRDDTVRVKTLFEIGHVVTDLQLQMPWKYKNPVWGGDIYFNEALKLSFKLNFSHGIDLFIKKIQNYYNQTEGLPIINSNVFTDFVSRGKLKPLFRNRINKHNGSIDGYLEIIKLFIENGEVEKVYIFQFSLGLYYIDMDNNKKAYYYFIPAIKGAKEAKDTSAIRNLYLYMGMIKYHFAQYDSAKYFFENALILSSGINKREKAGVCYNNLGEVYFSENKLNEALVYFNNSEKLFNDLKDTIRIAWLWYKQGRVYLQLKKYKKATKFLNKSLQYSRIKLDNYLIINNLFCLSELYFQTGSIAFAYIYKNKFIRYKDSVFVEELDNFFKDREDRWQINIGREITKKEKEALERTRANVELSRSNIYIFILSSFILVLIIVTVLVYRSYRFKKQAAHYLDELNKSKDRFYSIISHDLRSPLFSLFESMEQLKEETDHLTKLEIKDHMGKMTRMAANTKFLLDNLLGWSKAQKGLINYCPEEIDINTIVHFNIELYKSLAELKSISIVSTVPEGLKALSDHQMMDLIIRNFLNNALKFTSAGGNITIGATQTNGFITVTVKDTGIGITKREMDELLQPMDIITRRKRKTGLGLLLVKDYVAKMGGTLAIESKGKGQGACFSVQLNTAISNNLYGKN
jgi:signal transduction histidine kinase